MLLSSKTLVSWFQKYSWWHWWRRKHSFKKYWHFLQIWLYSISKILFCLSVLLDVREISRKLIEKFVWVRRLCVYCVSFITVCLLHLRYIPNNFLANSENGGPYLEPEKLNPVSRFEPWTSRSKVHCAIHYATLSKKNIHILLEHLQIIHWTKFEREIDWWNLRIILWFKMQSQGLIIIFLIEIRPSFCVMLEQAQIKPSTHHLVVIVHRLSRHYMKKDYNHKHD